VQVPKQIEDILKKEALQKGIDEEVLLLDKLTRDLEVKVNLYKEKSTELLEEAKKYLEKKDFIQASEKHGEPAPQLSRLTLKKEV
jgi:hypothetical protein